ncbi:MAG: hypothetical protein AMXMBFR33_42630 [Candidatus Xenobia bacterium]
MRLLFLLGFLLCGCITAERPLGSEPPDPALAGLWVCQEDPNNNLYLHVLLHPSLPEATVVRVVEPLNEQGAMAGAEQVRVLLTRDGYASMKLPEQGYLLARYELSGERLGVRFPVYDPVARAIEQGKLSGRAWTTTWGENVTLSSGVAELKEQLVWGPAQVFQRVSLPLAR